MPMDPATMAAVGQMALSQLNSQQQRKWNREQMEQQHQWDLEMWNMTNEYNSPANQVKRMQDAGLNPLYYGLDGSSAQGMQNAQALGYDMPNMSAFQNPVISGLQAKSIEADIALKEAEKNKVQSDTTGTQLDNEFKSKTMEARIQSETLKNELTKNQTAKINDERSQIQASIKETIAKTDNEVLRSALIQAQTGLSHMQAEQIAAMTPYQQLLMSAQSDAQRATASYNYAKAMEENGLLQNGYVDKMLDEIVARTGVSQQSARASEIKNNLATGNWYPDDNVIGKAGNVFIETVSTLGSIVTGPISGLLR